MRKHILNILLTTTLAFSTTDASAAAAEPEDSSAQSRLSQSRYDELVIENVDNSIKIRDILDELPFAIDERSISAALSGDCQQLNDLAEHFPSLAAFLRQLNEASDVLNKFREESMSRAVAERLQRGEEEKAARIKAQEEADAAMAAKLAAGEELEPAAAAAAPAEKALPDQEEGYVGFEQSPTSAAAAAAAAPAESEEDDSVASGYGERPTHWRSESYTRRPTAWGLREDDDSVASGYRERPTHWRSDRHAAEIRRVDNERTAEADEIFAKGFAAAEAARIKEQEEADAAMAKALQDVPDA